MYNLHYAFCCISRSTLCLFCFTQVYYLAFLFNLYNVFRTRSEAEMVDSDDEDSDEEHLITA